MKFPPPPEIDRINRRYREEKEREHSPLEKRIFPSRVPPKKPGVERIPFGGEPMFPPDDPIRMPIYGSTSYNK